MSEVTRPWQDFGEYCGNWFMLIRENGTSLLINAGSASESDLQLRPMSPSFYYYYPIFFHHRHWKLPPIDKSANRRNSRNVADMLL